MADDQRLNDQMDQLLNHPALRMQRSVIAMLWFNLLRGLAFGLGSVLGATILVYATVQILAQIAFIPILGDWAIQFHENDVRDISVHPVSEDVYEIRLGDQLAAHVKSTVPFDASSVVVQTHT